MTDPLAWFLEDEPEALAAAVCSAAHRVEQDTAFRYQRMLEVSCLYGDVNAYNASGGWVRQLSGRRQITHNVIANAVDALVAEVTQTQPRPMAVTVGGDWWDRQRARKLTAYWDAKWNDVNMRALGPQVLRDGVLFGDGWLRPYIEGRKVLIERIWPGHIRVDDRACIDVMPRSLFIARPIDRNRLIGLHPEFEDEIRSAPSPMPRWDYSDPTRDVVEVVEAWHLPSTDVEDGDDDHDGRHVVAIGTATLYDEPWTRQTFPLAHFRAVMPQRGWCGESLAWRAAPYQFELNKIARRIQESAHLVAVPRVFIERGSQIVPGKLNNELATIVEYTGRPPQFVNPPAMSADVYQYRRDLESGIFGVMGVSQMSAQSLKPAGINSGKAIRLYNDVQSRRFINTERAYEDLHVQLAREVAILERQLADEYPSHKVGHSHDGRTETVRWKDIDLRDERLSIQVFPASALPTTPAAKLQALEEMLEAGTIDQQTFYELADVPDLESARLRVTAPSELIQRRLDRILESGEYLGPEPYMDLARAVQMAAVAVQHAELQDAPEERIDLLRDFLIDTQALIERMNPPAPPAPPPMDPAMAGMPPGGPLLAPPGAPPMLPPGPIPGAPVPPMPAPPDMAAQPAAPPLAI